MARQHNAYLLAAVRDLRAVHALMDEHIQLGANAGHFLVQNALVAETLQNAGQLRLRFFRRVEQRRAATATSAMVTQPAATLGADEQFTFQEFGVVSGGDKDPAIPGLRFHAPDIMTRGYQVTRVMYAAPSSRGHVARSETSMHFRVAFALFRLEWGSFAALYRFTICLHL